MGNVNNCLINNVRFDEINIKPDKNNEIENQNNITNINKVNKANYFNNKFKFETVNEENINQNEKIPNDNITKITLKQDKNNILKISPPNTININENQNNINFNNVRYSNNGILLDNNVLFNSVRKSHHSRKSYEKNSFNENKNSIEKKNLEIKDNFTQDNFNFSENNFGSNKIMNTEEESDNLIILDYNIQKEKMNAQNNINVNNINGYNNNDGFFQNDKKINDTNPDGKEENIVNNFDFNNKNLISDNNNINKENYNTFMKNYKSNSKVKDDENKNDINEQTQKSDKTLKNDFIETTNIFKNGIPYSKPKLNLYTNDNFPLNNKVNNLINNGKEELNKNNKDNDAFFISKKNEEIIESNNKNNFNNDVEESNYISNVRKINSPEDEEEGEGDDKNNKNDYNINNKFNQEIIHQKDSGEINQENEENMNDDTGLNKNKILFQTESINNNQDANANLNNVNNEYNYNSNSLFNSKELNEGINSPIIKDKNRYFPSNENSISINKRYFDNNYPLNNNLNDEDIDELQKQLITQSEPKDKDSELEITSKKPERFEEANPINYNTNQKLPVNNTDYLNEETKTELTSEMKNKVYQKKNWKKIPINNLLEQKVEIINNADLISQENNININPEDLLTPIKTPNKIYKKKYINNTNDHFQKKEIKNNENENNNEILNNKNDNEEYEEFKDFDWDEWKRFYPADDRFFKFPKEGIVHNQELNDPKKEELYKGDLNSNGEKYGYGKFISPTLKRIGMWKKNNFTGWGREIRQNGDIYEGKFINGKLNGKGIYKNKIKNLTYIGDFINSERHGKGELFTKEYHYNGDFIKNKFEGKGKIELYNEGEYEGDFKNGLFDGKGMLRWKDGSFYKGELSKGKQDGYGEETDKDGNIYKGYYSKGNKNGEGKFITNDGNVYKCFFKDGKAIKNVDNN